MEVSWNKHDHCQSILSCVSCTVQRHYGTDHIHIRFYFIILPRLILSDYYYIRLTIRPANWVRTGARSHQAPSFSFILLVNFQHFPFDSIEINWKTSYGKYVQKMEKLRIKHIQHRKTCELKRDDHLCGSRKIKPVANYSERKEKSKQLPLFVCMNGVRKKFESFVFEMHTTHNRYKKRKNHDNNSIPIQRFYWWNEAKAFSSLLFSGSE